MSSSNQLFSSSNQRLSFTRAGFSFGNCENAIPPMAAPNATLVGLNALNGSENRCVTRESYEELITGPPSQPKMAPSTINASCCQSEKRGVTRKLHAQQAPTNVVPQTIKKDSMSSVLRKPDSIQSMAQIDHPTMLPRTISMCSLNHIAIPLFTFSTECGSGRSNDVQTPIRIGSGSASDKSCEGTSDWSRNWPMSKTVCKMVEIKFLGVSGLAADSPPSLFDWPMT